MADIKISELTRVSTLNNGDLVEVSQVNELAPSGYTSLKASMTDLGDKVANGIEYTTALADFTDKTLTGAINEVKDGLDGLTASTLPLSPSDPTTTKQAIEGKASNTSFTKKEVTQSNVSVGANTINTLSLNVNDAVFGLIVGFYISGDSVIPMQAYFSSSTVITVRVRNVANVATTFNISIMYI